MLAQALVIERLYEAAEGRVDDRHPHSHAKYRV
jgi:hypothetical protein